MPLQVKLETKKKVGNTARSHVLHHVQKKANRRRPTPSKKNYSSHLRISYLHLITTYIVAMSGILFEDMFNVDSVDNARYNKVSRIEGQSSTAQDIKITLDINSELFPVKESDSLTITLASSLGNEDSMITSNGSWRPPKRGDRSLADDYDYVMFGTVYKFEESQDNDKMAVYISFGGLLMRLEGGYRSLSNLKQENAYILIRHYKDN